MGEKIENITWSEGGAERIEIGQVREWARKALEGIEEELKQKNYSRLLSLTKEGFDEVIMRSV